MTRIPNKSARTHLARPLEEDGPESKVDVQIGLLTHQYDFMHADDFAVALVSGLGAGKTWVGTLWSEMKALANPGVKGLVFANTYRQLKGATLDRLVKHLGDHGVPYDLNRTDMILNLEGGTEVYLRSTENFDDLRGVEFGWAYGDEVRDMEKGAIDVIRGRLRDAACDAIELRLTTTPAGMNWIYMDFKLRPMEARAALEAAGGDIAAVPVGLRTYLGYRLITATSDDNPYLPEQYMLILEGYDPLMAEQERRGKFVNIYSGRCYPMFDFDASVSSRASYQPGLPIAACFDFNSSYPAPMACVLGHDVKGDAWAFDEIAIAGGNTPEVCAEIINRYPHHRAGIWIYGDATGQTKGATTGKSDYAVIAEHLRGYRGFRMVTERRDNPLVVDRIAAVNGKLCRADQTRHLIVHPRCKELILDLDQVCWKPGTRVIDKSNPLRTHLSDAAGYWVHEEWPLQIGPAVAASSRGADSTAQRYASAARRGSIAATGGVRQSISTGRRPY